MQGSFAASWLCAYLSAHCVNAMIIFATEFSKCTEMVYISILIIEVVSNLT